MYFTGFGTTFLAGGKKEKKKTSEVFSHMGLSQQVSNQNKKYVSTEFLPF